MSHKAERKAIKLLRNQGYWALRATGSMGAIDVAAGRDQVVYLIEVKETSRELADGTQVVYLTSNDAKGVDQRDVLHGIQEAHPWTRCGFLVRAKGRWLPDQVHRWSWHPMNLIGDSTVLRTDEGMPLHQAFRLPPEHRRRDDA